MFTRRQMVGALGVTGLTSLVDRAAGRIIADTGHRKVNLREVTIDARPGSVKIDLAKTAVLVVDMQNDFGSKGGMFDRAGIDISMIRKAIPPTAKVLAAARKFGIKVVYLKMAYQSDLSDLGPPDSVNRVQHLQIMHVGTDVIAPNGKPSRILIRDTWNTSVVDELKPVKGDIQLYKTRFSGFYKTPLHELLTNAGVRDLIVTGCTTSVCVDSTIRDAMFRDYRCVLMSDCTGEPIGNGLSRSNHEASLLTVEVVLGWVSNSDEFVKALT
jgi:ureidoacrylate peracid hydrolase